MRTKLIYDGGSGSYEIYHYECPCGKGKIIEEHDTIAGYRDHSVRFSCDVCKNNYIFDTSNGVSSWFLVERKGE